MRNFIILVVVVAAAGYFASEVGKMYTARGKFQERVDHYLGVVDGTNTESIKQALGKEAAQLGLRLSPGTVRIGYVDAADRTLAQDIVGDRLGTQFVNKRASIVCRVTARLWGIEIGHEIKRSRLIQVKAVQSRGRSELETMIDAAPRF